MAHGPRKAPDRELLLANHTFPGPYTIKAFGPGDGEFEAEVHQAVRNVLKDSAARFSSRSSSKGGKLCVTAELQLDDVDQLIAVYEQIHTIEDLKLIL